MTDYTAIVFQTLPSTLQKTAAPVSFKDDTELFLAIGAATGNYNIEIKRENYEDGTWSTWFSLTSTKGDVSLRDLALSMEKIPGLGSVMLKTDTGKIEGLHPVPRHGTGLDKPPGM